jgi:hypothetical protein
MQSGGLTARMATGRSVLGAALFACLLAAILGCGAPATRQPVQGELAAEPPADGARPVNINEQLVATTMDAAGLVAPYRVIGIRLGVLGDLKGFSVADRAAVAAWQGTDRTELDDTAWQVQLVGTQPTTCPDRSCLDRSIQVEAYVSQLGRYVIAITMRPLATGDPLDPSSGG